MRKVIIYQTTNTICREVNNASQVFNRDSVSNQAEMEQLFKRPSLTMNGDRNDKKANNKNKASQFKMKQIETWVVNK